MTGSIQLFLELELINGREAAFQGIIGEIGELVKRHNIKLSYTFYRDPAKPSSLFAIETHQDLASMARYFELGMPVIERARACTRPVRILILGNLPPEMKAMMEMDGATVVPHWLSA